MIMFIFKFVSPIIDYTYEEVNTEKNQNILRTDSDLTIF